MRWFFILIKIILYIPIRIIFPCKIIGRSRLPKNKTYVTVTNHLSAKDIILLGLYLPGFRFFLAKKELAKNRFVGFLLKMLGAVYIDRSGFDLKTMRTCIATLKKAPLAVFPEGTRNQADENIQAVKGGAAMIAVKAGADIYPVMIHHRARAFRRDFMFVSEKAELPFTKNDRFNNESMRICVMIMTEHMNQNKEILNKIVTEKNWREYNKKIRQESKKNKINANNSAMA